MQRLTSNELTHGRVQEAGGQFRSQANQPATAIQIEIVNFRSPKLIATTHLGHLTMNFALISEEEYSSLPADDERCFVEFERICQSNMLRMINSETRAEFNDSVREQYMVAVAAVAQECRIPNIGYDAHFENGFSAEFARFSLKVQGEVARIRIRQRGERHPYSVLLTGTTRTKIEHYVGRIRDLVDKSEMDAERKKRLWDKLDQLTAALGDQRLSFAKTMACLSAIIVTIAAATTIAAEGQAAVTQIMALIGHDKESEERAQKRLAPPPKALAAPATSPQPGVRSTPSSRNRRSDLDDDIPF